MRSAHRERDARVALSTAPRLGSRSRDREGVLVLVCILSRIFCDGPTSRWLGVFFLRGVAGRRSSCRGSAMTLN
eukprot:1938366-Rhodomonas_salina.1